MNKNENQRNSDDSFFGESAEIEIWLSKKFCP
jgi:hypothetical protein